MSKGKCFDDVVIKMAARSELSECAAIIRGGFAGIAERFGLTPENCPTNGAFISPERLEAALDRGNEMYAAFSGGARCGFVSLARVEEQQGLYSLEKLAVLPEYRHFAIGRRLVERAVARAGELGVGEIVIGIIAENLMLHEWYKKLGFLDFDTLTTPALPFTVRRMRMYL